MYMRGLFRALTEVSGLQIALRKAEGTVYPDITSPWPSPQSPELPGLCIAKTQTLDLSIDLGSPRAKSSITHQHIGRDRSPLLTIRGLISPKRDRTQPFPQSPKLYRSSVLTRQSRAMQADLDVRSVATSKGPSIASSRLQARLDLLKLP